jgi:hypothetical protein
MLETNKVRIGPDKWNDDQIQVWDADTMAWREPQNTEERVEALMALVLKIGSKLQQLGR